MPLSVYAAIAGDGDVGVGVGFVGVDEPPQPTTRAADKTRPAGGNTAGLPKNDQSKHRILGPPDSKGGYPTRPLSSGGRD